MKYSIFLFVVFNMCFIGKVYPDSLCSGFDVSKDPKIEARMIDGIWYSQRGLGSASTANSINYFQFQGKDEWLNSWNLTTRTCTYQKYENRQQQSLLNGPYSPCFKSRRVIPPQDSAEEDLLFYTPTKNLLMLFSCPPDKVLNNQICTGRPFVKVMTRTLDISEKELSLIRMRLRRFGVNQDLSVIYPSENGCRIPKQQKRTGKSYGRINKQW